MEQESKWDIILSFWLHTVMLWFIVNSQVSMMFMTLKPENEFYPEQVQIIFYEYFLNGVVHLNSLMKTLEKFMRVKEF